MNTLADFTDKSLLIPQCTSRTAEAVLWELCARIHEHAPAIDARTFYDAARERETMSPTTFCPGWALPHARIQSVTGLCFALGRLSQPLAWFGESRPTVRMVFLFAVPEAEVKSYLNVIAAMAKLSQSQALAQELLQATSPLGMFSVMEKVPLRPARPISPGVSTVAAGGNAPVKILI